MFIRKMQEEPTILEHFKGGEGHLEKYSILNGAEEMYNKGRVFDRIVLQPGCEIGRHTHTGDIEVMYIISGHGKCMNGDMEEEIGPGSVIYVDDGDDHHMWTVGDEPMIFVALVLFTK